MSLSNRTTDMIPIVWGDLFPFQWEIDVWFSVYIVIFAKLRIIGQTTGKTSLHKYTISNIITFIYSYFVVSETKSLYNIIMCGKRELSNQKERP